MKLIITTPNGSTTYPDVQEVYLPGVLGGFTIMNNHAPLISLLKQGDIRYVKGGRKESVRIPGGFVEVHDNTIRIISEQFVKPDTHEKITKPA